MKIWTLDNDEKNRNNPTIDEIVAEYIDFVTNPYNFHRQTNEWKAKYCSSNKIPPEKRALKYDTTLKAKMTFDEGDRPVIIENLPKPNRQITEPHFIALIHQLKLRSLNSKTGRIDLNTGILQDVSENYNWMLKTLCHTGIINVYGESGQKFAKNVYYINPQNKFKYVENTNVKVIKHIKDYKKELLKLHKNKIEKAKEITSPAFIKNYNKAVRCFKMLKPKEAYAKVEKTEMSKNARDCYHYIISKIEGKHIKEINSADDNGRIYHIGTQTPRIIRQYTNISNIIDARNSHPVLFNHFILEYYFNREGININGKNYKNENIELYRIINKHNKNKNNYTTPPVHIHYFTDSLCNLLYSNKIEKDKIAIIRTIPKDVWMYLHSTANGTLWDEIKETFPDFLREDIKKKMFKEVFYSNAKYRYKNMHFAVAFNKKYPNVTSIINHYKTTYKAQCKVQKMVVSIDKNNKTKDKIQLAHKLMQLESYIFTEILTRLFRNRKFKGVGIHDAIAIFDNTIEPEKVTKIMEKVYEEVGLYPTFSINAYNSDCGTMHDEDEIEYFDPEF